MSLSSSEIIGIQIFPILIRAPERMPKKWDLRNVVDFMSNYWINILYPMYAGFVVAVSYIREDIPKISDSL